MSAKKDGLEAVYGYAGGDMRHAINIMQAAAGKDRAVTPEGVEAAAGLSKVSDVDKVLASAVAGDVAGAREKMIELTRVYGMSESDFVKYASAAVVRSAGAENLGAMLRVVAEYDYRILSGANPEVQLSAMLAELAALGAGK